MKKLLLILLTVIGLTACDTSDASNQLPNNLQYVGETKIIGANSSSYQDIWKIFKSSASNNCYAISFRAISIVDCTDFIPKTETKEEQYLRLKQELNK